MKIETVEFILDMVAQYGIPAVQAILHTLEQEEVTEDELRAKLAAAKDPRDYFGM